MKKKAMEFSVVKLILILFVVLLIMAALYRFYWQPAKKTLTPILGDLEKESQKVGQIGSKPEGNAITPESITPSGIK